MRRDTGTRAATTSMDTPGDATTGGAVSSPGGVTGSGTGDRAAEASTLASARIASGFGASGGGAGSGSGFAVAGAEATSTSRPKP